MVVSRGVRSIIRLHKTICITGFHTTTKPPNSGTKSALLHSQLSAQPSPGATWDGRL